MTQSCIKKVPEFTQPPHTFTTSHSVSQTQPHSQPHTQSHLQSHTHTHKYTLNHTHRVSHLLPLTVCSLRGSGDIFFIPHHYLSFSSPKMATSPLLFNHHRHTPHRGEYIWGSCGQGITSPLILKNGYNSKGVFFMGI